MRNKIWIYGLVMGIIILFFSVSIIPSTIGIKERNDYPDQQQTIATSAAGLYPPYQEAQSFKPTLDVLTRVQLFCKRSIGATTGDLIVSIRYELNGSNLGSISVPIASLPIDQDWVEFNFSDQWVYTVPEMTYYIVVTPTSGNQSNVVFWYCASGDPYPRGCRWYYSPDYGWINLTGDHTFITYGFNFNKPPNKTSIQGETNGRARKPYTYTFVASDPEGDDVFYQILWSDSSPEVDIGPYPSGIGASITHSWPENGTYKILARAKDVYGAIGEWGTLNVTMPCSYHTPFQPFWERLLERFPQAFLFLRHLMGY